MSCWTACADGVMLSVRVTPRGGRDALTGVIRTADGRAHLAVKVRVAPEDGAANQAVVRLVARAAGLAPRDVTLSSGHTARIKRLQLRGDPASIAERLGTIIERTDG